MVDNCDLCFVSDDGTTLQAELKINQHLEIACPPGTLPKEHHCGEYTLRSAYLEKIDIFNMANWFKNFLIF